MNVNIYLFFFQDIVEWISFSLTRHDRTLMILLKKIGSAVWRNHSFNRSSALTSIPQLEPNLVFICFGLILKLEQSTAHAASLFTISLFTFMVLSTVFGTEAFDI